MSAARIYKVLVSRRFIDALCVNTVHFDVPAVQLH
jgi:hypothetical protein